MAYTDYTFAQDKRQYYPSGQPVQPQQAVTAGQVAGETPQQFAAGKAAANSATGEPLNLFKPVQTAPAVTTPVQTDQAQGKSLVSHGGFAGTGKGIPQTKPITSMEDLAAAMGYTSPQEEERLRKASVANQRILAVGDALRQIGNIYNTTRYAPSQQFNSPVELERQRYLQGKALRDKANQIYLSYQQQKAAQDAKQKQWEAEYGLKVADAAGREALRQAQRERQGTLAALDKARAEGAISQNEYNKLRNEWYPKVQQATIGQKNASAAAARTRAANDTKRANAYVEKQRNGGGGSGGRKNMNTIYSRRGYLTKEGATDADMKRIYDNLYEWGKKRGSRGKDGKLHPHIDEGGILSGIAPNLYGGKQISDVAKREAVDKMIMEHDDAAVELAKKYGFTWHEGTPSEVGTSGNWDDYLEDEDDWSVYEEE